MFFCCFGCCLLFVVVNVDCLLLLFDVVRCSLLFGDEWLLLVVCTCLLYVVDSCCLLFLCFFSRCSRLDVYCRVWLVVVCCSSFVVFVIIVCWW